jgi:hypothetical protein
MEKILIIASLVTFLFVLGKFAEMKIMDTKMRPLKDLARETIMVFMSGITAAFIYFNMNGKLGDFMNTLTDTKILPTNMTTEIFTGTPEF